MSRIHWNIRLQDMLRTNNIGRDLMTNMKEIAMKEIASRRRSIDPATCERDYDSSEVEFMQALEQYKNDSGRRFPTCSEILTVLRSLGYVRVMPCSVSAN